MDLNELALFLQVARLGSFAQAGKALGMPASTVSRQVQNIEHQLGVRLMQRSTRRLVLTEAGKLLVQRCEAHFSAIGDVTREVLDGVGVVSGTLRIATPSDFFDWFPLSWIREFRAMHPKVRLEIFAQDTLVDVIGDGIDIAFRAGKLENSRLIAILLTTTSVFLVASAAYLSLRGTPRSPEDLALHDGLTLRCSPGQSHREWRVEGPDGEVRLEVQSRFSASAMGLLRDAAVEGLGIALLPEMLIRDELDAGLLQRVLPAYGQPSVSVSLLYPSRQQVQKSVSAFVEFAVAKFGGRATRR
ncbi:LysR family transcriptional regulator [Variovorax sp. E3]|uniref:LysR family transcriptional regulator n=1 Tax=Variovorax sp. E3 TaxID=1914993 RepID=UPI0018DD3A2B|nr:LysR family transcriptional regulator [Variovorax sp. E3]